MGTISQTPALPLWKSCAAYHADAVPSANDYRSHEQRCTTPRWLVGTLIKLRTSLRLYDRTLTQ